MPYDTQIVNVDGDQNNAKDLIEISYEEFAIYDVFYDELIRKEVDPVAYYGYDKINQMIQEWVAKK